MRISRILTILLLASLLLIMPVISTPARLTLFNFQKQNLAINIKSPNVLIESNIHSEITINVSYYNPVSNHLVSLYNGSIYDKLQLTLPHRGYYVFTFFSVYIAEVTIAQRSLPLLTPVIISILLLLNVIVSFYHRFKGTIEY